MRTFVRGQSLYSGRGRESGCRGRERKGYNSGRFFARLRRARRDWTSGDPLTSDDVAVDAPRPRLRRPPARYADSSRRRHRLCSVCASRHHRCSRLVARGRTCRLRVLGRPFWETRVVAVVLTARSDSARDPARLQVPAALEATATARRGSRWTTARRRSRFLPSLRDEEVESLAGWDCGRCVGCRTRE